VDHPPRRHSALRPGPILYENEVIVLLFREHHINVVSDKMHVDLIVDVVNAELLVCPEIIKSMLAL